MTQTKKYGETYYLLFVQVNQLSSEIKNVENEYSRLSTELQSLEPAKEEKGEYDYILVFLLHFIHFQKPYCIDTWHGQQFVNHQRDFTADQLLNNHQDFTAR